MTEKLKIFDHHQHVGWYTDGYHSPKEVWHTAVQAGVLDIAVSSTSTCAELYKLVVREMKELKRLGGEHFHPILWISPRMMKTYAIRYMLRSKVKWECVKMHWLAHKEWYYNHSLTLQAINVARKLNVPILLHTGEFKECSASVFTEICSENSDLSFILAHGRPINETIALMHTCNNVYVDTAFMPVDDICKLANEGFRKRVLFGTDTPIDQVFQLSNTSSEYVEGCVRDIQEQLPEDIAFDILINNRLFNNN